MIAIYLLAIYGLAFALKEIEGPFGVLSKFRNLLFTNKFVGVFFYKLFDCYLCLGFWCGMIIHVISGGKIQINLLFIWGLAGGSFCYIMNVIFN